MKGMTVTLWFSGMKDGWVGVRGVGGDHSVAPRRKQTSVDEKSASSLKRGPTVVVMATSISHIGARY
jgi:hypothetical protein